MQPIHRADALRRAQAWLCAGGGVILLAILAAADREPSDHVALMAVAGALLLVAVAQLLWRGVPDLALLACMAAGIVSISLCVGLLRPMGLTPVFYVPAFLLAANHLSHRQIAFQYGVMVATYGAALVFLAEAQDQTVAFVTMTSMIAIIVLAVLRLRKRTQQLVAQLRRTAACDSLTGALNRGAFEEHLRTERARSLRHERPYAVAIIDVDHLKQVNEEHGHAEGDAALVRLAGLVRANTRAGDVFARVGGEEFALLLVDTDLEQATVLAEGLRGLVRRETAYDRVPLTVSIGVAAAPVGVGDADVMLAADRALYGAKRAGSDRGFRAAASRSAAAAAVAG